MHKDLFYSDSNLEAMNKAWFIGLLSDYTLSEEKLSNEVERVKKEFIDLRALLEY